MREERSRPGWNLSIPEETDRAVRAFLGRAGGKKGDLSRLVNDAVRRRVFDRVVSRIEDRNAVFDQQEILDAIDEGVTAARKEPRPRPRSVTAACEARGTSPGTGPRPTKATEHTPTVQPGIR